MKNTLIIILAILLSISLYANDTTYKGYLRILDESYFKGANVFGEFSVNADTLYFKPKCCRKYVKNIMIPLAKIAYIDDINYRTFRISLSNGCSYMILLTNKKDILQCLQDQFYLDDKISIETESISNPEDINDLVLFNGWGAFLYKRIKINGKLELRDNISFYPNNTCIFKSLYFSKEEIKKITTKKNRKVKLKLNNGERYCFIDN